MNVDESYGTMMVSLIGIANTIGRILCGILSSSASWADPLILNNIFITVGGVVTMLSCISMTIEYQLAYSFVFGLSICTYYYYFFNYHLSNHIFFFFYFISFYLFILSRL